MVSLQVLNPVAQSDGKNKFHAAKRVSDLRGKKIGLYDNGKSGGAVAQQRLIEWLGATIEGSIVQRYSGSMGGRKLTVQGAQARSVHLFERSATVYSWHGFDASGAHTFADGHFGLDQSPSANHLSNFSKPMNRLLKRRLCGK